MKILSKHLLKWVLSLTLVIALSLSTFFLLNSSPKNVILITIDTLRADRLETHGYTQSTSPFIKMLADRGTSFEWAFSTSNTTAPSHASIMTGMYPKNHSIGTVNKPELLDSFLTLAEVLKQSGYQTSAVVSNPVLSRPLGLDQGFDVYNDTFTEEEAIRKIPERRWKDALDQALSQLSSFVSQKPFFLWVHFQDPHGPYTPDAQVGNIMPSADVHAEILPVGEDHTGYRAIPKYQALPHIHDANVYRYRYDAEIRTVDLAIGQLLDFLDERDFFSSGYVVLTSDHGEAMGENEFYFSHGNSPLPDQTRVPLIYVGPGVSTSIVTTPVSNATIFPTVLELLDIQQPPIDPDITNTSHLFKKWSFFPKTLPIVFVETGDAVGAVTSEGMLVIPRDLNFTDEYWKNANVNASGGPVLKIMPRLPVAIAGKSLTEEQTKHLETELSDFLSTKLFQDKNSEEHPRPGFTGDEMIKKLQTLGYIN